MREHRGLREVLVRRPVVALSLVVPGREGLRELVRDALEQHVPVEEVFRVVERISVIEVHRAAGARKGGLGRRGERGGVQVVEDLIDFAGRVSDGQEPAEGRGPAVGAHGLDRGAAERVVDVAVVDIFHDGAADKDGVVFKVSQGSDNLVFLFVEHRLQSEPRLVVVIKRVEDKDQRPAEKQDATGARQQEPLEFAGLHRCFLLPFVV